jgi:hypothetical protein
MLLAEIERAEIHGDHNLPEGVVRLGADQFELAYGDTPRASISDRLHPVGHVSGGG